MTRAVKRTGHWLIKVFVGLSICLFVYDRAMPIYTDVQITQVVRSSHGMKGKLTFRKIRDCAPTKGSIVAFAHFGEGFRMPVRILNSRNELLTLKNFPPSETPVSDFLIWELAAENPAPSSISIGFDLQCIFPISNRVDWHKDIGAR